MVATPTLPAIKNARLILDVWDALEYPPEKMMFVLNRMQSERERGRISAEAIENNLKRSVNLQIPIADREMTVAVNRGTPLVTGDRSRPPARELTDLANQLHIALFGEQQEIQELEAEQPKASSRLSRLFRVGG